MDPKVISREFHTYLESLKKDTVIDSWIYMGKTGTAYGSPGGSWKGEDGFLFKKKDEDVSYILRSVSKTDTKYIVIESNNLKGQLYNINLSDHKKHSHKGSYSIITESYVMTSGKGKVKASLVKEYFRKIGIKTNEITKISDANPNWQKTTIDLLNWGIIREKVKKGLKNQNASSEGKGVDEPLIANSPNHNNKTESLNQILFGPPGTGKTYNVVPYALNIINGFELKDTYSQDEWESLKQQFDDLRDEGRIEFVTFHQSMNYEDFVEGIKPKMDETSTETGEKTEQLQYEIVDGVFKRIADRAAANEKISRQRDNYMMPSDVLSRIDMVDFGKFRFENWMPGNEVYEYCMSNNCICIPYEIDYDFSDCNDEKQTEKILVEKDFGWHEKVGIKTIKHWLKDKDIVFVTSVGKNIVKGIAQINGDYYYDPESPFSYSHFRRVKWLMTDISIPVESIYTTQFSSYAASLLYRHNVRKEFFKNQDKRENLKYVLIIDEINRGNIAAIFGELITLLEPSKRIGGPEHFKIKLPYSKSDFEVPSNLYIVGTMNTADRSVEALDTALRRRFCFVEMPPLYDFPALDYEIGGINAFDLLKTINIRIEKLLDKDHLIGHSYFIKNQKDEPESKLLNAFYKNIIPLLQEYFYGDYGKIGLVLGEGFVNLTERNDSGDVFAEFTTESSADYEDKQIYRIIDYRIENQGYKLKMKELPEVEMTFSKAIKLLMRQPIE